MPAIPHQLRPGTILNDRYLVGGCLGQGGFGITYVGRDLKLDMRIAIKEYYPTGYANRSTLVSNNITVIDTSNASVIRDGIQKFLSEARILARFDAEPGVVSVRDFFEANQTAYIIMEFLDGKDLGMILNERLFRADEIFHLMEPVMNTLEKIHSVNIIHRDISPDNLMLLNDGSLKLMDFGSARLVDYSDRRSLSVVLKAGFAPEEQYRSKGIQGPWTDIYALCATIYKCISGITPDDALDRGYQDTTRWPSEMQIPISPRQEAALKKGMAFRPEERFQNIAELRQALAGPDSVPHYTSPLNAAGPPPSQPSGNKVRFDNTVPVKQPLSDSPPPPEHPPVHAEQPPYANPPTPPPDGQYPWEQPPNTQSQRKVWGIAGILLVVLLIAGGFIFSAFRNRSSSQGNGTTSSAGSTSSSSSSSAFAPATPTTEPLVCPFDITLDGISYRMPIPVSELLANGWHFNGSVDDIGPNDTEHTYIYYGAGTDNGIFVEMTNPTSSTSDIEDCIVTLLSVDDYDLKDTDLLRIAGSIEFHMTRNEVETIMADKWIDDEDSILSYDNSIYYTYDFENNAEYWFDDDNRLSELWIYCNNHEEVDSWLQENLNGSTSGGAAPSVPDLTQIVCPFDITLGGKSYRMPIPVSELEADGWHFDEAFFDTSHVEPHEESESTYMFIGSNHLNGIWVRMTNPDSTERTIEDCVVTTLAVSDYDLMDVDLEVAESIGMYMSKDEVESIMRNKWIINEDTYSASDFDDSIYYYYDSDNYVKFKFNDDDLLDDIWLYCKDHEDVDSWLKSNPIGSGSGGATALSLKMAGIPSDDAPY